MDGDGSAGYLMDVDIFQVHLGWFYVLSGDAVIYEMSIRRRTGTGNHEMGYLYESLFLDSFWSFAISASQREMHELSKLTFRFYPVSNAVATALLHHYIYRYVWCYPLSIFLQNRNEHISRYRE